MQVEMAATDFGEFGCDLVWRMTDTKTGREVARGKTGIAFFDYRTRPKAPVPAGFRARSAASEGRARPDDAPGTLMTRDQQPANACASPAHVGVIGGGPAGLMAAEVLAKAGLQVTVFDAMPSVGRKFLLAGRGGLNLTHGEAHEAFL